MEDKKAKSKKDIKTPFLTYKGKPLVRSGNMIYYGSMADEFVIMMQIMGTKEAGGRALSDKVLIQLVSTDESLRMKERVIKKSEKNGLYNAMDIASIWLERALKNA